METVLQNRWIKSLESAVPEITASDSLIPFELGSRFGYIDQEGRILFSKNRQNYVSMSKDMWAEYDSVPGLVELRAPAGELLTTIDTTAGYPVFFENRVFLIGNELATIHSLDVLGNISWSYDFPAPITCIDSKANLVLAGLLDGSIELINAQGQRIFTFEPGGSRLSVIAGCSLSQEGTKIALISGIDRQRFLLLEQSGETYKVTYHEFLEEGFRRPVHITFIDNGNRVVFERYRGVSIFEIKGRKNIFVPLAGDIQCIDNKGNDGLLFLVIAEKEDQKQLVMLKMPGIVIAKVPFKSADAFLAREDSSLFIGSGSVMTSFELGTR